MSCANDDLIMINNVKPSSRLMRLGDLYRMRDTDFALDLENDQFLIDNVVDDSSYDLLSEVNVLIDKSMFQNCLSELKHKWAYNEYENESTRTDLIDCRSISRVIIEILNKLSYDGWTELEFIEDILDILREEKSLSSSNSVDEQDIFMILAKIIKLLIPLMMIEEASMTIGDKYIIEDLIREYVKGEDFANKLSMIMKEWNIILHAPNETDLSYKFNRNRSWYDI